MSTGTVILLVIVLVIIAVVAGLASTVVHRQAARWRRVGAEFGRLARETGPRRARAEFNARRRRVDAMGIKPLSGERRSAYERQWTAVQERFVDSPAQAVVSAAGLVTAVAAERGYDVTDSSQLLVDLSVYHGQYLDGYRRATETTERAATAATEELRQALLGHRALFQDLLAGTSGSSSGSSAGQDAEEGRRGGWRQVVPSLPRATRGRDRDERDRDDVAAARS